jgi:hypothetical protein
MTFVEAQPEGDARAELAAQTPAAPTEAEPTLVGSLPSAADAPLAVASVDDTTQATPAPARTAIGASYVGVSAAIAPVRLYEATSFAHGYISQLPTHSALAQTAAFAQDPAASDLAPVSPRAVGIAGAIERAAGATLAPPATAAFGTAGRAPTGTAAAELAPAAPASAAATRSAAALEWLARRLHLTAHSDGRVEVWVRDFRLDAQERDALGFAVLSRLQAEGRNVARVSVNGHAVWTAAAIDHQQEHHDAR